MPLHPGHGPDVISKNIRELQDAGHEHEQAVAIALSSARKSQKMAEGGMVGDTSEHELSDTEDTPSRSIVELNEDSQPFNDDDLVAKAMEASDYKYSSGGMVEDTEEEPTMHDENMEMSSEAKRALEMKKKSRRY